MTTNDTATTLTTDEQREAFRRDGAVVVRQAFNPDHVALATEAIDANLADLSERAKRASADSDGAFIEDFCNWQRIDAIERFVRESPAAAIAGELTGSSQVRLYHDHMLTKEPGTRQRTPWHQDQPYYNVDGRMNASMWFPVDPVSRSATLEFVAGSHSGEWFMPRSFMDDQAKWFPEGSLTDLPDIESNRRNTTSAERAQRVLQSARGTRAGDIDGNPDAHEILGWALEPGDAVFFNMLTLHAAGGVDGPNRRRVLSVRMLGDDMVHAPRRWTTSPPFDGLADELPAGAPMDHPLFPVLWQRDDAGSSNRQGAA